MRIRTNNRIIRQEEAITLDQEILEHERRMDDDLRRTVARVTVLFITAILMGWAFL